MRRALLAVAAVLAASVVASPVAFGDEGGGKVIYDATVQPLPGNLPSVGAEAYAFAELGDQVTFAGKARKLKDVTVTLSSWGCQSGSWYAHNCVSTPGAKFSVPITFNIYKPGPNNTAGALIATKTQTFDVPYRPSSDNVNCPAGKWYTGSKCFNGLAVNVTFNFKSPKVTLPDAVVYGITYNTSHYGPNPIGESPACYSTSAGCPYDSLNIALSPTVTVGSKPFPNTLYQNSAFGYEYCDGGLAGVGTMRLDSPSSACWYDSTTLESYIPAVQFTARPGEGDDGDGRRGGGGGEGHGAGGGSSHSHDGS
jgi:hypothetical protein